MTAFSRCLRLVLRPAVCSLALACVSSLQGADGPSWWISQEVLKSDGSHDDYAAANAGQMKNLAVKAAAEMDRRLGSVDGAGSAIHAMVQAWLSQTPQAVSLRDDYAVLTVGQVKNVVSKFHDQISVAQGTPAGVYPWSGGTSVKDDYSVVNVGQLKAAFSFNIPVIIEPAVPNPMTNGSIPAAVFTPARQRWLGLSIKPLNSSVDDFDGDGISNAEEYRMSLATPSLFPPGKAIIDQDDLDGDGIPNSIENNSGGILSALNFADAVLDSDGDGLTNYEEAVELPAAGYPTQFDNDHSIRDGFVIPGSGDPLPGECTLTDGQILQWRRDIDRWNYDPGMVGAPASDIDSQRPNVMPSKAPAEMWEWTDTDGDSMPDGYALWLAALNGAPSGNAAATADVDGDGLPNLWEHRYRLGIWSPSNSGNTGDLVPLGTAWDSLNAGPGRDRVFRYQSSPGGDYADPLYWEWDYWHYEHVWKYLPPLQDPEGDTLPNWREYAQGTNPRLADTDGDSFNDELELRYAGNPKDPASGPPFTLQLSEVGTTVTANQLASVYVHVEQAGIRMSGKTVTFELDTPTAGSFPRYQLPPTTDPIRHTTDSNGDTGIGIQVGPTAGIPLTLRITCGSTVRTVTWGIDPEPDPPILIVLTSTSATTTLKEGETISVKAALTQGGAPYVDPGRSIAMSVSMGSFLPNTGTSPLQNITLTLDAAGEATVSWKAPLFGMGSFYASFSATSDDLTPGGIGFQITGSRESPVLILGSDPPTDPPDGPALPPLYTSVRTRYGSFTGTDRPNLPIDDGGRDPVGHTEWVVDVDDGNDPPPYQTAPDDGFDGDLDEDNDDAGDPRDENARTTPYQSQQPPSKPTRAASDEELANGQARAIEVSGYSNFDSDSAGTSDGPVANVEAQYLAANMLTARPPEKVKSQSASFEPGQLNQLINGTPWSSTSNGGWMGDGYYGVCSVSTCTSYSRQEIKETFSWQDRSHQQQQEERTWTSSQASKTVKQIRLNSREPVKQDGGASIVFRITKTVYSIPTGGDLPEAPEVTDLGTVQMMIPKGEKVSKSAVTTKNAGQYLKTENGETVIELKEDEFIQGKQIVMNAVGASFDLRAKEDFDKGWDNTGIEPWTCVGVGKTNELIKLVGGTSDQELIVDPGSAGCVSISNATIADKVDTLFTISGSADSESLGKQGAKIILRQKDTNVVIATLHVHVLAPKVISTNVFYASDDRVAASQITNPQPKADIKTELDATYENQACITFSMTAGSPYPIPKCYGGFAADGICYTNRASGNGSFTSADVVMSEADKAGFNTAKALNIIVVKDVSEDLAKGKSSTAVGSTAFGAHYPFVESSADISTFAHETGHALLLSTKTDPATGQHHDMDKGPDGKFGLMYPSGGTRWLRQEDWRQANKYARSNY